MQTGYGLTETSPIIAMNTSRHHRSGSVGRPLPGTEVRIDGDGDIKVRGPGVMLGYWGDADQTACVIDTEGWFATGDRGHLDGDGYLYITGRSKTMIVLSSGKKVQPEEVQQSLALSLMFSEVCVVGIEDSGGGSRRSGRGERVCAVVVPTVETRRAYPDPAQLQRAAEAEVRRECQRLSKYKQPSVVVVADDELPRTAKRTFRYRAIQELASIRLAGEDAA